MFDHNKKHIYNERKTDGEGRKARREGGREGGKDREREGKEDRQMFLAQEFKKFM